VTTVNKQIKKGTASFGKKYRPGKEKADLHNWLNESKKEGNGEAKLTAVVVLERQRKRKGEAKEGGRPRETWEA